MVFCPSCRCENVPLKCKLPPCNCTRCQKSERNTDKELKECLSKKPCYKNRNNNPAKAQGECKKQASVHPLDKIIAVLFDIIGTMAFIVMVTITFWCAACIYLWKFFLVIYNSGRKSQLITCGIFAFILICLIFHGFMAYKPKLSPCSKAVDNSNKKISLCSGCSSKKPDSETLCNLCAKKSVDFSTLCDKEVQEIYDRYELITSPLEWKSLPLPIVHVGDYIKQLIFGPEDN